MPFLFLIAIKILSDQVEGLAAIGELLGERTGTNLKDPRILDHIL